MLLLMLWVLLLLGAAAVGAAAVGAAAVDAVVSVGPAFWHFSSLQPFSSFPVPPALSKVWLPFLGALLQYTLCW